MREVRFSPREKEIIDNLKNRKMTIIELSKLVFKYKKIRPAYPNSVVGILVSRINDKCERLDLNWRIAGEGMGRAGKTVWREKR